MYVSALKQCYPRIVVQFKYTYNCFSEYHLKPIDGTEATHPLKMRAPFEMIDQGVKYMTLQMPENHNSTVYGAVMRTPTNGKVNIVFPMVSQDEGPDRVGRKEKAKEWKIFLIPLTKNDLQRAAADNTFSLEIDLELVKRRWQQNIQIVSISDQFRGSIFNREARF